MKKIIINADDFGASVNNNEAIKLGFQSGVITSTSMIVNMKGFEQAIQEVLPEIPFIDLGFHFNITKGRSLTFPSMLTNNDGYFNRSYTEIMLKSQLKKFQTELENEFRTQIEQIMQYKHISHIDSHNHIHTIPSIFKLVTKLAKEYKIPYIRTYNEIPYKVKSTGFSFNYEVNSIKSRLLNFFTYINKKSVNEIKTTDFSLGVIYAGNMTTETIFHGLEKINEENSVTEVIFHPSINIDNPKKKLFQLSGKKNREFEITQDKTFRERLDRLEYLLTSFNNLG